jgi:uncharacterized protein YmfQ (DUF2313 family)
MDTRDALLACLPASAYDTSAATVVAEVSSAGLVIDRALGGAGAVLIEQQPDLAAAALGDWERNYGLPDDCAMAGGAASEAERRADLLERIPGLGNLSRQYFIAQATRLGYVGCTVTEYGPMTAEEACDSSVNGDEFIGVWSLNVPGAVTVTQMNCESTCDSALSAWGDEQLGCLINRRKPAHSVALLAYLN